MTTEEARDPKFTYTPQQFILSYGETALYISVMGDPETGIAPLEYVKIFFRQFIDTYSQDVPIANFDLQRKRDSHMLRDGDRQRRRLILRLSDRWLWS